MSSWSLDPCGKYSDGLTARRVRIEENRENTNKPQLTTYSTLMRHRHPLRPTAVTKAIQLSKLPSRRLEFTRLKANQNAGWFVWAATEASCGGGQERCSGEGGGAGDHNDRGSSSASPRWVELDFGEVAMVKGLDLIPLTNRPSGERD